MNSVISAAPSPRRGRVPGALTAKVQTWNVRIDGEIRTLTSAQLASLHYSQVPAELRTIAQSYALLRDAGQPRAQGGIQ